MLNFSFSWVVSENNPWHGVGLLMLWWMFTLIHKLNTSEWIPCRITGQWNKPMRQNHLRRWNLCSGVVTELWLGTKWGWTCEICCSPAQYKHHWLSCVLKMLNFSPDGIPEPKNVLFLYVLWDPCLGLLSRTLGKGEECMWRWQVLWWQL